MTYENIDKDKDGVADLPADGNFESVETGTLSVGQSSAVTAGPMADSGEWVVLSDARYQDGPWTTTALSWERVVQGASKVTLPVPRAANIVEYAVGFSVQMRNQTSGETTSAQLEQFTDAEVTVTGSWEPAQSTKHIIGTDNPPDAVQADIQMKVTSGTGELEQATFHVWGKMA